MRRATLLLVASLLIAACVPSGSELEPVAIRWQPLALCPFPITLSSPGFFRQEGRFDQQGVLQWDYGMAYGRPGWAYSPGFILQYALSLWNSQCEGGLDLATRQDIRAQLQWLRANAQVTNGAAVWLYSFPNRRFGALGPWASAYAQGLMLWLLAGVDQMDPQPWHHQLGDAVTRSFAVPIEQGGVRIADPARGLLYQGVAYPGAASSILNESIFGILGLYQFAEAFNDQQARGLATEGVRSVARWLPRYDAGWISFYDLLGHIAPAGGYNLLQSHQLALLASITGVPSFSSYSRLFLGYEQSVPYTVTGTSAVPGYGPVNLIADQPDRTYWSSAYPAELVIHLDHERSVIAVVLREETPATRPRTVAVHVSLDGVHWFSLGQRSLRWITEVGATGITVGQRARHIRLDFTGPRPVLALNYLIVKAW